MAKGDGELLVSGKYHLALQTHLYGRAQDCSDRARLVVFLFTSFIGHVFKRRASRLLPYIAFVFYLWPL